jgi:serine/threonine protein kinase
VVIKQPLPELLERPELLAAVLRAQRLALHFDHPRLERVLEVREGRGVPLVICLPIAGVSLRQRMRRQLALRDALLCAVDIARGLDHVHACGLVHRDVKPANVVFDTGGQAVLADFGLLTRGVQKCDVRRVDQRTLAMIDAEFPAGAQPDPSAAGTPFYMSPEQAAGEPLGPASDFYSLGVLLHELLDAAPSPAGSHREAPGIAVAARQLPAALEWLQPVIDGLLAPDPAERISSSRQLRQRLDAVLSAAPEARGVLTLDPQQADAGPIVPPTGPRNTVSRVAATIALLLVGAGLLLLGVPQLDGICGR